MGERLDYAFPHSADDEDRRLGLLEQRLDPITIRRIERLGILPYAVCLEIGGGRGSITRWLAECPTDPQFPGCGFVHIGAWGRRPA